jgi:cell division protein FtsB
MNIVVPDTTISKLLEDCAEWRAEFDKLLAENDELRAKVAELEHFLSPKP